MRRASDWCGPNWLYVSKERRLPSAPGSGARTGNTWSVARCRWDWWLFAVEGV